MSESIELLQNLLNVHNLNSVTVDVFTPALITGASEQLKESMLGIAKKSVRMFKTSTKDSGRDPTCESINGRKSSKDTSTS